MHELIFLPPAPAPVQTPAAVQLVVLSLGALSDPAAADGITCAGPDWLCGYVTQPDRNKSQKDFLRINNYRPRVEGFSLAGLIALLPVAWCSCVCSLEEKSGCCSDPEEKILRMGSGAPGADSAWEPGLSQVISPFLPPFFPPVTSVEMFLCGIAGAG